jgi:CheY-like chemotaxis protein
MMEQAQHTVLLINDDADTTEALRLFIGRDGHAVETAENGEDALDVLRGGLRPCIIVLDLMMPVMDGFEFRYEQMKDPEIADIPVIVCSAAVDPQKAAQQLRAAAYVQLTSQLGTLRTLVREHCRR